MAGCRILEGISVGGVPAVCLENEMVRIVVLVGKGTDIYDFTHKPSDTDLLWKSPWGVRNPATFVMDTPNPNSSFLDYYEGGWQELFPNASKSCVYQGAELGLHGEVCKIPWEYRIEEDSKQRVSVLLWVRTVRTPFLVVKRLILEANRLTLAIEETITNEGAVAMHYLWGHHPAFGAPFLSPSCRLIAPVSEVETHPTSALPSRQKGLPPGKRFPWPNVTTVDGQPLDLSRIPAPEERVSYMSYLIGLEDGWYVLLNEETRLAFGMRWDKQVFPCIWFWEECCGSLGYPWWGRCYVVGIEPQTSYPGVGLAEAVQLGIAPLLEPGASISHRLLSTACEIQKEPKGVDSEGVIVV